MNIVLTAVDIPKGKKWSTVGRLPLPFVFNADCIGDEERKRINAMWEEGKRYVITICEVLDENVADH